MEELKPCPFCRNIARLRTRRKDTLVIRGEEEKLLTRSESYKIACSNCGCGTSWMFYKEDAIAAWNTRAGTER